MSSVIVPLAITGGLYAASVALDKFTSGPIDGTQTGWLNGLRVTWSKWRREANPFALVVAVAFENLWIVYGAYIGLRQFTWFQPHSTFYAGVVVFSFFWAAIINRLLLTMALPHPVSEWFDMRFYQFPRTV
jgi:hypothetical protein